MATGISQRHLIALSEHLSDKLEEIGYNNLRIEGKKSESDWVIVDVGDIMVHLFRKDARELYNIEKMWASAELIAPISKIGKI